MYIYLYIGTECYHVEAVHPLHFLNTQTQTDPLTVKLFLWQKYTKLVTESGNTQVQNYKNLKIKASHSTIIIRLQTY